GALCCQRVQRPLTRGEFIVPKRLDTFLDGRQLRRISQRERSTQSDHAQQRQSGSHWTLRAGFQVGVPPSGGEYGQANWTPDGELQQSGTPAHSLSDNLTALVIGL